jgi:hypothetical protein
VVGNAEGQEKRKIIRKQDDGIVVFTKSKVQKTQEKEEVSSQSEVSEATK